MTLIFKRRLIMIKSAKICVASHQRYLRSNYYKLF